MNTYTKKHVGGIIIFDIATVLCAYGSRIAGICFDLNRE